MAWTLDTAHMTLGFEARHMGLTKVRGQFDSFRGEVEGDPADITTARGRIEVDTASIDTGNEDRDAHLRSPDFFDAEKFPTMLFEGKEVRDLGNGAYKVVGDLTIKDITKAIELDYEHGGDTRDPFGNRKIGGTLTGTINRRDWGLNWNVPLDTGGVLVSENIKLVIDFELAQSKAAAEEGAEAEAKISA